MSTLDLALVFSLMFSFAFLLHPSVANHLGFDGGTLLSAPAACSIGPSVRAVGQE